MKIDKDEPCPCASGRKFGDCHGESNPAKRPPSVLRHVQLAVIPEPDPGTRSVIEKTSGDTVIFLGGSGGDSLDCGSCGAPLAVRVDRGQFVSIVLRCNNCASFNDT